MYELTTTARYTFLLSIFLLGSLTCQAAEKNRKIFGYKPKPRDVQAALEIFDACPKEKAFAGVGTKTAVRNARKKYKAKPTVPDASWVNYWMAKTDRFIYDMISPDNPHSLVPNYSQGCPLHLGKSSTLLPVWGKLYTFRCVFGGEEWAPDMKVKNPATGKMVEVVDPGDGWRVPKGFPQHKKLYLKSAYRLYLIRMVMAQPYIGHLDFDGPEPYRSNHEPAVKALAWAYAVTQNQKYANKALIILNRIAENYRYYNSRVDTKVDWRKLPQRGYIGDGIFENNHINNLSSSYDLLFNSLKRAGAVVEFFDSVGDTDYNGDGKSNTEDLRYNIEHNLFGYCWEFLSRNCREDSSNGRMGSLQSMANLGLIFQNDKIIENVIDGPGGIRHGVISAFYRGGRSHEDTSSYARYVNGLYQGVGKVLSHYKGKKIYTDGLDVYKVFGSRFGMIDTWQARMDCDGALMCYGDGGDGNFSYDPKPRNGKIYGTVLAHELGMTIMRQGDNAKTRKHVLLYHAFGGVGHGHPDQLMLKTQAYGYDFSADLGYPENMGSPKRREWGDSTAAHPTVMIDQEGQPRGEIGTSASADIFARSDWAQIAAAYSYDAFPDAQLYHRTAAVVQVDPDHHFVIDIFRVKGGTQHDWLYQSHSGEKGDNFKITCNDKLKPRKGTMEGAGVEYLSPTKTGYSYINNVKAGKVTDAFTATWLVGDEKKTGYKIHMLGAPGREVFTGKCENRGIVHRSPLVAKLVVRSNANATTFIAVHEAFQGDSMNLKVEPLNMTDFDKANMPAGVKITANGKEYRFKSIIPKLEKGKRYQGPQSTLLEGPKGKLAVNWPNLKTETRGKIIEVDYANSQMKVSTDADLTKLTGKIIYIQNPAYKKNSRL